MTDISFAGNDENTATNLYDAQFREYDIQGRWPSPDPAGVAAANPANPQSWNRYAYVLNNPLLLSDPTGLQQSQRPMYACGDDGFDCNTLGNPFGGGGCTLDGVETYCGIVEGVLGAGAGTLDGDLLFDPLTPVSLVDEQVCTGDTPFTGPHGEVGVNANCRDDIFDVGSGDPGSANDPARSDSAPQFHLSISLTPPQKPSCWSVAASTAFDELKGEVAFPAGQGPADAARAVAQAGAASHVIERGLVYPLKSSIVRNFLEAGEAAGTYIVAYSVIKAEFQGLRAEYQANRSRTCSTWLGNP